MKISEEHLREPGLVVIDITTADGATATRAATALGELWLSSGPSSPPRHTPGQAGVTVRAYADLRRTPLTGNSYDPGTCRTSAASCPSGAGSYRVDSGSTQFAGKGFHFGRHS
ncbi:DUF6207 family protein [Streptomyces lydicus]